MQWNEDITMFISKIIVVLTREHRKLHDIKKSLRETYYFSREDAVSTKKKAECKT